MKTKVILAVLGLFLLLGIGWATRYRYDHLAPALLIRTNRYTGETCALEQTKVEPKTLDEALGGPTSTFTWTRCGR